MIYLSLPYFYENLQFYNILKQVLKDNRDNTDILTFNFDIEFSYGSFPFSFWNGNINSNYLIKNQLLIYQDYIKTIQNSHVPISLDLSNIYLQNSDIYDNHLKALLNIFKDMGTYLEVNNCPFAKDINQNFSNYRYILSKNNEILDKNINEQNENFYSLIQILPSLYPNEELKKIKNKNKYQIVISEKKDYLKKIVDENLNQISFSSESYFSDSFSSQAIDLAKQIKQYADMGFNHFIIDQPHRNYLSDFNKDLLDLVLTPEGQYQIRKDIIL